MKSRVTWLGVGTWILLTFVGMMFAGGFHFPGGYGLARWSPAEMEFSS